MFVTISVIIETLILVALGILFIFMGLPMIFPGAPFVPSYRRKNKEKIGPIISFAKEIAPGKNFVDIGSGDGRVVIEFAQNGFKSTGIEINPFLCFWSKHKIKKLGIKNAEIIRANFWKTNIGNFDVIYIFQLTSVNLMLCDKFRKELKPGTVIISVGFPMFGFDLIKQENTFWIYKI